MEGMKFDAGKAAWDLIPTEYFIKMAEAIQTFIEMHILKDGKLVFEKSHIYNIARANIMRWWYMRERSYTCPYHPLTMSMIAICMLQKERKYTIEDLKASNFSQRWDLIDPEWTTKIAEIYSYGARKYAPGNWKFVSIERYYSALNRHIDHYLIGEIYDKESGFPGLFHAAWNCIALQWLEAKDENNQIVSSIPPVILKAAKKLSGVVLETKPVKTKKN